LSEHFVSNVFAFTTNGAYITANFLFCFCFANSLSRSTGEIIACKLNAPESWHDSHVACPIYRKWYDQTPEGFYLVTNTAFPQGTDQIKGCIRAPMKEGTHLPADELECAEKLAYC